MEPKLPPAKIASSSEKNVEPVSLGSRFQSLAKESAKLENLPFVVLILLAGISLISRLWLIRH
jgi:hypothetical protein